MRVLITGGRGFIGSHLARELEDHGHRVTVADRAEGDLAIPGRAERLIESQPDYVVHLAARYGRLLCRDKPHRAVTDNASATTELAAACADWGVPVLYASSSEVYGDHGQDTITEESELRMPTTIYGLSKRWGEEALRLYLPDPTIVRLNMAYGPEQRAGYGCCALATFIDAEMTGRVYTVHRGTSRSWLYITDLVRALRLIIEEGLTGVYNLGNDLDRRTMHEVAQMVGGNYEVIDPPEGQIPHKNYSAAKLRAAIDWKPEVSLEEGIARTIEWAKTAGFRDYSGEQCLPTA